MAICICHGGKAAATLCNGHGGAWDRLAGRFHETALGEGASGQQQKQGSTLQDKLQASARDGIAPDCEH